MQSMQMTKQLNNFIHFRLRVSIESHDKTLAALCLHLHTRNNTDNTRFSHHAQETGLVLQEKSRDRLCVDGPMCFLFSPLRFFNKKKAFKMSHSKLNEIKDLMSRLKKSMLGCQLMPIFICSHSRSGCGNFERKKWAHFNSKYKFCHQCWSFWWHLTTL